MAPLPPLATPMPAGARLECRTPWFVRYEQHGSTITSVLEQRSSQLQKQFAQNLFEYESNQVHTVYTRV